MKKICGLLLLLCLSIQADSFLGEWDSKIRENIRVDYRPVRVHCQKLLYTKGGLSIEYPQEYFSIKPYLYVTIELNNGEHSPDVSFSPVITFASSHSITVVVHKQSSGYISTAISEADNDEVYVHVFSFGT